MREYCDNNLLNIIQVYEDDGCKGGNFDRPAFQQMIQDIEEGIINCVLVKDLSRFGREHIEGDYYLEKFFPSKGVRFIAMLDNIDSVADPERMNSIEVPLMNLLNEQYLKDVSNSTKISLSIKRKEGKFVGAVAPYGYTKSKDDKHKLIVDEEVKPIVERIFSLYIDYHSQSEIARILNQNRIFTPSLYTKSKEGKDINSSSKWTSTTIKKILTQPIYTGDMVQGRTRSYSHKVNKRIPLPKDEWIRIEGTHEAIIDKAIFNQVQSMITKNVKPTSEVKPSLFAGLLVCAECGKQMQRSIVSPADKSYSNFVCSTYKKFGKSVCSSHLISEEVISEILISSLNLIIKAMIDVDTILAAKNSKNKGKKINKLETEILILGKKQIELRGLKTETYNDLKLDIITNDEYKDIISYYNKQIDSIADSIQKKKELLELTATNQHHNDELFVHFNKYKGITKLTRSMICDLVDSITVDNERNVVINYRFANEINEYIDYEYS